jgi:hypothetical protein
LDFSGLFGMAGNGLVGNGLTKSVAGFGGTDGQLLLSGKSSSGSGSS